MLCRIHSVEAWVWFECNPYCCGSPYVSKIPMYVCLLGSQFKTPDVFLPQVAVARLLKQLSDVYSTMKVSELAALVPFMSFSDVEAIIVDAVKYDYLQVGGFGTCHIKLENATSNGHVHLTRCMSSFDLDTKVTLVLVRCPNALYSCPFLAMPCMHVR